MKQQVFYIHGGEAFSQYDDFLTYLKSAALRDPNSAGKVWWPGQLRDNLNESYEVFMPAMPNKQNAKYEEWKVWFERHFEYLDDKIVLVGWSLGGMFLLKYLSENEFPYSIRSLLLVGAVYPDGGVVNDTGEDGGDFQFDANLLTNVSSQAENITLYHSEDDFIVPYEHALKLKEALPEAELITFTDRNHFLQEEFPELLEKIREAAEE